MNAKRGTMSIAVLLLALALVSCAADEESDKERLAEMKQEILHMVGIPVCTGEQSCRFVAFGAKPCGGPWEYLIYSVDNVEEALLLRKVREYNEFEEELNAKYGYVSDCTVPNTPLLGCEDGRCVDLRAQ